MYTGDCRAELTSVIIGEESAAREGGHKLDGFDENYGFDKFVRSARSDWGFMTL